MANLFEDSLGDPFGTGAAKDANKANSKRHQQALGLWSQLGGQQELLFNRAEGALQNSLGTIRRGYGDAKRSVLGGGDNARRSILAREKQNNATTQQSLVSRGLYGSSTLDAATRGESIDTNMALSTVDETIARLMSELQIGQAESEAGALRGMASFTQNRAAALADLTGSKVGTITGRQDVAAPGWLSTLTGSMGGDGGGGLMDIIKLFATGGLV